MKPCVGWLGGELAEMSVCKPPGQPGTLWVFGSQPTPPAWALCGECSAELQLEKQEGAGWPEDYHPNSAHDLSAEASATRESEGAVEVKPGVGLGHLEGPGRQGTVGIGLGMIGVPRVWERRREKLQEGDEEVLRVARQDPGCCCFSDQTKLASGRRCLAHLFGKCFCTSQLHPLGCPAEPKRLVACAQLPLRGIFFCGQGEGWWLPFLFWLLPAEVLLLFPGSSGWVGSLMVAALVAGGPFPPADPCPGLRSHNLGTRQCLGH